MKRIRILVSYFGRWPSWMPLFLKSCERNADIDWLFHTDCGPAEGAPDNVRFCQISFADYCKLVEERLQIPFSPASAYKLCDLKPLLGYIHETDLEGYDFWGFGDLDLVYGNLRHFFTDQLLSDCDLVSTHGRRVSGHLCLLRNTPAMRQAFMQVPGWKEILAAREHLSFDESAFSRLFVKRKNWPDWARSIYARLFSQAGMRACFTEQYTTPNGHIAWHDNGFEFPGAWYWSDGTVTNNQDGDREFPYFHFMFWKRDWADSEAVRQHNALLSGQAVWCLTREGISGA